MAHRFASLSESSDTLGSAALTGTLVPPLWKSAIFWNVSTRDGVHWNSFVVDWVLLPKFQGLFVPGKARNSLFRSRPLFFGVIALRVYFRRPRPPSSLAGFCSTPPDGKCYLCLYTRVMRTFRFGPIRFLTPPPPPTLLSLPFSGVLSSLFFLILFYFVLLTFSSCIFDYFSDMFRSGF